jgi:leucyl-tRNA synthetase
MDFKKIEEKWQKKWEEAGIFEAEPDSRKKFYITVAYPYPSGSMHTGHVRTYTVPDIMARFKRMQGFNVLFPMAWHVTGTPIIGAVKRLKEKEKKQLHVLRRVFKVSEKDLKKMQTPLDFAGYFIEKSYIPSMKALGYSIDWRRQFTTNDLHYNKFIEWQHGILYKKGFEKQGMHPVKWCLKDKNPVTTHDLLEGENAEIQEFTLLKFKFGDCYIIAATMRPETVFGQTNIWVDPEIEYVKAQVGKEKWIMSGECVLKLRYQRKQIKILGKIKGSDMIGKYCFAPGIERKIIILPSRFCDPNIGTGMVTSVPSDAPYDWIGLVDLQRNEKICKKYGLDYNEIRNIEVIPIIKTKEYGDKGAVEICKKMNIKSQYERSKLDNATKIIYKLGFHKGVMNENAGKYKGMKVEKAKELVKKDLIKAGKADIMYEFSEPVTCRCGGRVVVAKTRSWFIDYGDETWRKITKKCLDGLKTIPTYTREDYLHAIEWLGKWPCVRNFGLGTPLPQDKKFMIEPLSDSTIYMSFYLIAHKIKKYKPEQLKPEFFDYVMLEKGNVNQVEKITGIQKKELKSMQDSVQYWYPLDFRTSANDLIQNHLTFMLFHHTAIFPAKNWPKGIVVCGMGLLEGGKMSSSKGNIVLASDAIEKYGADTIRLFLLSSVEPWQDFDWRDRDVKIYRDNLLKFYNKFIFLLRNIPENKSKNELTVIDRWLLSKLNKIIRDSTKSLENFQTRNAGLLSFFKMMDAIRWYERRSVKMNAYVLRQVLENWIRILAPFIPFISEELWERLGNKGFVSSAKWPKVDKKLIDEKIEQMEEFVKKTLDDINEILKIIKKTVEEIHIYIAPRWKHVVYNTILENVKDPRHVVSEIMKNPEIRKSGKDVVRFAESLSKDIGKLKKIPSEEDEYQVLTEAVDFLKKELKVNKIKVWRADDTERFDPENKSIRAAPMKPAIYIK